MRLFRVTNSDQDLQTYLSKRNAFKCMNREKKLNLALENRNKLIKSRTNPHEFWRLIKSCNSKQSCFAGSDVSSTDWYNYFKKLLNVDVNGDNTDNELKNIVHDVNSDELNMPISDSEIIESVNNINNNRSPGEDGICIELYKYVIDDILPFLNALFNEILDTGIFPEAWSLNIITPIHKKGSVFDPNNFRGVSLIDSVCKIFTNIVCIRLTKWSEQNNIIDESQAGFRKGYSTVDNIFILQALIQKYLSKKRGRFYCMFVDFQKAFDSIQHNKLWDSLLRKSVDGKILNVFKSMYEKLKSCVKCGNGLTNYFNCTVGTRQGCVTSPIIFILFINDLVNYLREKCGNGIFVSNEIEDIFSLEFADDIAAVADTVHALQRLITSMEIFCNSVKMNINFDKTKIIVFRNGGILKRNEAWTFQGQEIEVVPFYKYLGLFLTPKLVWTKSVEMLSRQALKSSAGIFRY